MSFDYDTLRELVAAKKEREGLSYRAAMTEIGVEYHTLWHFINKKGKPESEHVIKLAEWVGLSLNKFCGGSEALKSNGDTLSAIGNVLGRDPSLNAEARLKLMDFLTTSYRMLARGR